MKNFNELPASIKNEVKNLLKVYDKCFVTYENAAYTTAAFADFDMDGTEVQQAH